MTDAILIIDDSLTVRADLEEAFSEKGMRTISCASAAQARALFESEAIGLVILDVLLPDGDGIDLLRELRATPTGADIPVLMLSSEAEVKDRIRGLLTGSSEYIGKPYDRDHVIARTRELLGAKDVSKRGAQNAPQITVLVIDDSATFRESFGEVLRAQGFHVLFAESGEEGLKSASLNRPDAIVVDDILPGINGSAFIRKLRLDAALRDIPCIILTGSDSFSNELLALDSGADAFVRKEENLSMILARVTAVLRNVGKFKTGHTTASLLAPKRILAVDDSLTYLQELNDSLCKEGYDVILAHSGEEALEMLAVQAVDCILLDRIMPGIDGTETCRRIKASAATRDIPLIMLTAMEDHDAMIEGLSTGADDYVVKSNETSVVNARVRTQLRRKQFEEEGQRVRMERMNKELQAAEARAAKELAQSRAELMAELEKKNHDLEMAVEKLRQGQLEIEERNQQLQSANRLKSEFVSNMSHEIRTPMNAIMGFAYLLGQQDLDTDSQDLVNKIRNAGRTLQAIINDILDFSKIEAGWLEIEHAPFRISSVLDNLSDIMSANTGHKDIELVITSPPDIGGQLYGDTLRLEQILINLTGNAIKFSDHGAIVVNISLQAKTESRVTLRFSVTDSGIGIPFEKQAQIFDAFSQADASTTRRFGGTGLGLTICRHLVDKMGGQIGVISAPGKGSEFWFTIPFEWRAGAGLIPCEMQVVDVLIVDDNRVALDNLALTAKSLGWSTVKAGSGTEALEKMRARQELKSPFNAVIIDWKMPDMDGLATAQRIRDEFKGSTTAIVIMVTAFSRNELLRKDNINVVDGVINKPATSSFLYKSVVEAMYRTGHEAVDTLPALTSLKKVQRLTGLHILIVDDSEINREVAMRIIGSEGAVVSLAEDGKQAFDFLCSHKKKVDMVLMDVQMPVMDGYEATRQLRALPKFVDLPIIALTAGAFKVQQDAAIEAGMNAFASKPFNVDELVATIQRLTHYQTQADIKSDGDNMSKPLNDDQKDAIDISQFPGMDIQEGMEIWGEETRYCKFLYEFCTHYVDCSDLLEAYFMSGDHQTARTLLHKLKGDASYLALTDIKEAAALVEATPSSDDLTVGLKQLRQAMETTLCSIVKFTERAKVEN